MSGSSRRVGTEPTTPENRSSTSPWAGRDPRDFAQTVEDAGRVRAGKRDRASSARWFGIAEGPGPQPSAHRRALFARFLALADALAAAGAVLILYAVSDRTVEAAAFVLVPAIVAASKVVGLYDNDDAVIRRSTLDEAPALFQVATLAALCGTLAEGGLGAGFDNGAILAGWLGLFVLLVVLRMFARRLAHRVAPEERILFVGDRETYWRFSSKVEGGALGVRLLGWVPFGDADAEPEAIGSAPDLPVLVVEHDVHRVVVVGSSDHQELVDVVRLMKLMGIQVSLLPILLDVVGSSVQLEDIRGLRLMGVRSFGLSVSSRFVKRSMDLAAGGIGMLLLAPVFAAVAVAIKLDSRGAVFFRQTRVGRNGARFEMFKFRSMVDGAEDRQDELRHLNETEGFFKIADDPRITRVGRWLRRTSLDELPQLLNVLRGEMSLVGPRPLVVDDDRRVEGWHRQRLHLTPGMTGAWQVLGSSRIPLDEMVKIDYLYVANWSLWNDVKLILRTVPIVLGLRGI